MHMYLSHRLSVCLYACMFVCVCLSAYLQYHHYFKFSPLSFISPQSFNFQQLPFTVCTCHKAVSWHAVNSLLLLNALQWLGNPLQQIYLILYPLLTWVPIFTPTVLCDPHLTILSNSLTQFSYSKPFHVNKNRETDPRWMLPWMFFGTMKASL